MPFKPRGLEAMDNPLRHKFGYAFNLSAVTADHSSAWMPIIRSSLQCTQTNVKTILVNPKNSNLDQESGAMCTPMSIIQNLNLNLRFNGLRIQETDEMDSGIHGWWMPFFCSFEQKYIADDDNFGNPAAIMQLTSDGVNEDVVPLTTQKLDFTGSSDLNHPVSTVNFAEVFGTLNYTTDITMESCDFDETAFYTYLRFATAKGALKSCLGRRRDFTVGARNSHVPGSKTYNIKGFVPKTVRRILPFGFFGILVNIPLVSDFNQMYNTDGSLTADKGHVGVKMHVTYDEWNEHHDNTM